MSVNNYLLIWNHLEKTVFNGSSPIPFKFIAAIYLIFYSMAIVSTWNTPTIGYEMSIYRSTPVIFWVAILFGLVIGIYFLLYSIFHKINGSRSPNFILLLGFVILSFTSLSFMSLHILRGYYSFSVASDVGAHIAHISSLLESGTLSLHYPARHCFSAILFSMTNADVVSGMNLDSILFILLLALGICLLSVRLCTNSVERIFVAIIVSLFPFGSTIYMTGGWPLYFWVPYLSAIAISPFAIYSMFGSISNKNVKFFILACIFLTASMFYHPVIFVTLALSLVSFAIWVIVFNKYYRGVSGIVFTILSLLVTCGIAFLFWFVVLFRSIDYPLKSIYGLLFEGDVTKEGLNIEEYASSIFEKINIFDLFDLFIRQAGLLLILFIFLAMAFYIVYKSVKKNQGGAYSNMFSIYAFLIPVFGLFATGFITSVGFQSGRVSMFFTMCGIIATSIVLYHLVKDIHFKNINYYGIFLKISVVVILSTLCLFGYLSYFPTSYTVYQQSQQTTHAELTGMDFYFKHIDYSNLQLAINQEIWRYPRVLYGSTYIRSGAFDTNYNMKELENPPDHFGYPKLSEIGTSYESDAYLILMNNTIQKYQDSGFWKMYGQPWTPDEFAYLQNQDQSVEKIYDNDLVFLHLITSKLVS